MSRTIFSAFVRGQPTTKGSLRPIRNPHTGKIFNKEQTGDKLVSWIANLRASIPTPLQPTSKPLHVAIDFYFARPKCHYRANGDLRQDAPSAPTAKGRIDGDKLTRAVWDALTSYLWIDDSQIWSWAGTKGWALRPEDVGARIVVQEDEAS